jgi:hypothetical protein
MFVRSEECMTSSMFFGFVLRNGLVERWTGKSKILLERYFGDRHASRNECIDERKEKKVRCW